MRGNHPESNIKTNLLTYLSKKKNPTQPIRARIMGLNPLRISDDGNFYLESCDYSDTIQDKIEKSNFDAESKGIYIIKLKKWGFKYSRIPNSTNYYFDIRINDFECEKIDYKDTRTPTKGPRPGNISSDNPFHNTDTKHDKLTDSEQRTDFQSKNGVVNTPQKEILIRKEEVDSFGKRTLENTPKNQKPVQLTLDSSGKLLTPEKGKFEAEEAIKIQNRLFYGFEILRMQNIQEDPDIQKAQEKRTEIEMMQSLESNKKMKGYCESSSESEHLSNQKLKNSNNLAGSNQVFKSPQKWNLPSNAKMMDDKNSTASGSGKQSSGKTKRNLLDMFAHSSEKKPDKGAMEEEQIVSNFDSIANFDPEKLDTSHTSQISSSSKTMDNYFPIRRTTSKGIGVSGLNGRNNMKKLLQHRQRNQILSESQGSITDMLMQADQDSENQQNMQEEMTEEEFYQREMLKEMGLNPDILEKEKVKEPSPEPPKKVDLNETQESADPFGDDDDSEEEFEHFKKKLDGNISSKPLLQKRDPISKSNSKNFKEMDIEDSTQKKMKSAVEEPHIQVLNNGAMGLEMDELSAVSSNVESKSQKSKKSPFKNSKLGAKKKSQSNVFGNLCGGNQQQASDSTIEEDLDPFRNLSNPRLLKKLIAKSPPKASNSKSILGGFQSPKKSTNPFKQIDSPGFVGQDANDPELMDLDNKINEVSKERASNFIKQNTFGNTDLIDHVQTLQKKNSDSLDHPENKENQFQSPRAKQPKHATVDPCQSSQKVNSIFTFHLSEPRTNQSEQEVTFRQIKQLIGTKNQYLNWSDMVFDSKVVDELLDNYIELKNTNGST